MGGAAPALRSLVERRAVVVEVPRMVRAKADAAGAGVWLRGLSDLVASLEAEWSIRVGDAFEGGTEAFVAPATLDDGTSAVLKLMVPRRSADADHEITVLRRCAGEGCVSLLRDDPARGALLLERLGPSLYDLGVPVDERHEILCTTARRVWRPADGLGLPTGEEKARWLVARIQRAWESLGRPCSEQAVEYAVRCARRRERAYDPDRAVLVHGDIHQWNALRAAQGFKLVDPDGLMAEPEYDLGIVMREDPTELMVGDPWARAVRLAALTGTDVTAIWEWGVVERVSTGLLGMQIGMQPVADQMLRAAEQVAMLA